MSHTIYFAIPGDINSLTGGYAYDRRLIAELSQLDFVVHHLPLANSFPQPDSQALHAAHEQFSRVPDGATLIIDGLALGVMDEIAAQHSQRLSLIALCHHPLALESGLTSEVARSLQASEQRALQYARAVIVTSANTARILQQGFAVAANKITVVAPGTDQQNHALCAGNPPLLLTVATLTERKAHDVLIDALAEISHLPWRARFVGGDKFNESWANYLREKVAAYSLGARITFVGSVVDVAHEYQQADLFVLPSLYEGYGMAFAEALSFGLPIIAARTGAVPDVVPESACILVPPADVAALANSLRQVLTNHAQRKQLQLGAQCAAQVLPRWSESARLVGDLILQVSQ